MAKQTFTTGQVLTAAQMTALQQTAMLGGDANARTASYILLVSDAGNAVTMSSTSTTTITVNSGIFAAGDIVTIVNINSGISTITAGTATVTTSGSLALSQNQGGILRFTSASAAIFLQFATPASGDIEGVTAGTGISGGGTSGTVTITNSMATAIDAKGDLVVGTGADTFSRLAVGTNGFTLVADSAEATGLKWAAASGGGMTLLSTTTLSGTSTTISITATGYNNLQILVSGITTSANDYPRMDFNSTSGTVYLTGTQSGNAVTATDLYFNGANELKKEGGLNTWLVDIANVNSTSYYKAVTSTSYGRTYTDANQARHEGGAFLSTSAITGVRIQTISGASFSAGQVLIYGVK